MQDSRGILNGIGERCIMKSPSVYPTFFPRHLPLVFSPCAPAAESSCPTTFDSRSYRGFVSASSQSRLSIGRRPLLLLYSLLLVDMLPRPPAWKYRTALPYSSAPPIAGWLIDTRLHNTTPSLHSFVGRFFATTGCSAPGLRFRTLALMVLPLVASPFASESQVPTFRSTAADKLRPP